MKKYTKPLLLLVISFIILILTITILIPYQNNRKEKKVMKIISTNSESITETDSETSIDNSLKFYHEALSEELKNYITGKSYKENENITFDELRHVVVQYIDFEGNTCEGELIVNEAVADETVEIFKELFNASYAIEKIHLIDKYNGDDDASMEDNNTSCFNYRNIDGQNTLSDHSLGLAIDINPLYNPYVRKNMGDRNILPTNGAVYADRSADFPHKITKDDICYNIFTSHGWKWGGEWDSPVDYQHFYKEYSKP